MAYGSRTDRMVPRWQSIMYTVDLFTIDPGRRANWRTKYINNLVIENCRAN